MNAETDLHSIDELTNTSSFLADITSLGDHKDIIAHRNIVSRNGVNLIKTGGRINSKILGRLVSHRLQVPIEECLSIEGVITHQCLIDAITALVTPNDKNLAMWI